MIIVWTCIHSFIKNYPQEAFDIALKYSDSLKCYALYNPYDAIFGFESFYEKIHRLAYSDANLVQNLAEKALLFQIIARFEFTVLLIGSVTARCGTSGAVYMVRYVACGIYGAVYGVRYMACGI